MVNCVPVDVAVPAIPIEVPKYPVLQRNQLEESPKSSRLSDVGKREELNLELIFTTSVVVALPSVVFPSTDNVLVPVIAPPKYPVPEK